MDGSHDGGYPFIESLFMTLDQTMDRNWTSKQRELLSRLSRALKFSRRSRHIRLLTQPWKMLYPRLLRMCKATCEVNARTFWGEKISVVVPEVVANSIWRYGYFEEDVCLFMLRLLRDGMTFIDIGAHLGFFTLLGAYVVGKKGKVLSFEPIPYTYEQLKKNTAGCSNVDVCNYAAFSEETEIRFYDYGLGYSGFNSAFGMRTKDHSFTSKGEHRIRARRIDDVCEEKGYEFVDVVKIDAEGAENHVLKGMTETLNRHRPNIIMEVGDFEIEGVWKSEDTVAWLENMGYCAYEVSGGGFVKHNKKGHYEYGNLLFMTDK